MLRFESFQLDLSTGELRKNGGKVRLQDQPAKLLALLATRRGELVTRAEIQKALWGDDQFVEFEHAINTAVRKIRDALEDDPAKPRMIETVPRKGYRFIAEVEEPSGSIAAPSAEPEREIWLSPETSRRLFVIIQLGYLAMYCTALGYLNTLQESLLPVVAITAMCGIAIRLYLASSVGFGHRAAGEKFRRIFPVIVILDGLWAASPLLATRKIGYGIALVGVAGLAYLPFSQRTLMRTIYGPPKP